MCPMRRGPALVTAAAIAMLLAACTSGADRSGTGKNQSGGHVRTHAAPRGWPVSVPGDARRRVLAGNCAGTGGG